MFASIAAAASPRSVERVRDWDATSNWPEIPANGRAPSTSNEPREARLSNDDARRVMSSAAWVAASRVSARLVPAFAALDAPLERGRRRPEHRQDLAPLLLEARRRVVDRAERREDQRAGRGDQHQPARAEGHEAHAEAPTLLPGPRSWSCACARHSGRISRHSRNQLERAAPPR